MGNDEFAYGRARASISCGVNKYVLDSSQYGIAPIAAATTTTASHVPNDMTKWESDEVSRFGSHKILARVSMLINRIYLRLMSESECRSVF